MKNLKKSFIKAKIKYYILIKIINLKKNEK